MFSINQKMYLNTGSSISLIFVIIIVINLNHCQVLLDSKDAKGQLVVQKDSEQDMVKLCKEFCATRKNKECKMVVKYKHYDADKNICTCVDQDGSLMNSKIYKPEQQQQQQPLKQSVVSNHQKLSKEKTKKPMRRRMKRQMIAETVLDDGTEVVGMTVTPPHPARRAQYFGGNGYGHGRPPHMPMPMPPHHCNQFTCMNQCPYGCDSLCRMNGECYCSCPDDLTYEYYDDSFFGSLFG